jgi:GNAT superfamily N-acetyltransferase
VPLKVFNRAILYVKPEFRQQGVFRKLYEFITEESLHQSNVCGFRVYVVKSNHIARSAYTNVGMQETAYKLYEVILKDKL